MKKSWLNCSLKIAYYAKLICIGGTCVLEETEGLSS